MLLINPDRLAASVIWMEAQGEPYEGKVAVGEVIRHRMARKYSSDGTVAGTVLKRYQFSGFNDDKADNDLLIRAFNLDDTDELVLDCSRAWTNSGLSNITFGAVLYVNLSIAQPPWATIDKFLVKIGQHSFYRD